MSWRKDQHRTLGQHFKLLRSAVSGKGMSLGSIFKFTTKYLTVMCVFYLIKSSTFAKAHAPRSLFAISLTSCLEWMRATSSGGRPGFPNLPSRMAELRALLTCSRSEGASCHPRGDSQGLG